ncbi:MAG TPA: Gfo/Idh/MocA family oxidoreductase [Candidatus Hydrogenedentes bacterium]|nr:Gfo/Idh/MocA family oxidoreductase [Candidatus Hydrogenedentota bacterium]
MSPTPFNRRQFLGSVAAASVSLLHSPAAKGADANTRIKAGVIGLGGRGTMIAQMLVDHGGYDIVAVADYFPEVADRAGEKFHVAENKRFSGLLGYKRLMESGVEAVFLETPPYCFPDHVAAAVEAGCHVYMAKPVACDVQGCLNVQASANRAKANNRVFLVDFQTRTDPFNIEGVDRVHRGEIGKIGMISSLYSDESFSDPPLTETVESRLQHLIWVNDDALGGGYLVNAGIHAIDMALWLAGAHPISATGASRVARNEPHGDSHDVYSITCEFADGLIVNHRGEHLKNRFDFHCDCVAHCQEGYLETSYNAKAQMLGNSTGWKGGEVQNLYDQGARRNIAAFHEAVLKQDCNNLTVEPSILANLTTILGREAALHKTRITWDEMLKENRRLEPNLKGLNA